MTYRCLWCHNDIMDWKEAGRFLSKVIHIKCYVKLRRELKKEHGFELPRSIKPSYTIR